MIVLPNFLPAELGSEAIRIASENRHLFAPSQVSPPKPNFRESNILSEDIFPLLAHCFKPFLVSHLPKVLHDMGVEMRQCHIELEMTAHHNGHFFRRHIDNGSDNTAKRKVSFVCYFRLTQAQMFTGGELKLYDGLWYGLRRLGPVRLFNPFPATVLLEHNSIVFFKSDITHEVKPVHCADVWEHGRFALSGWLIPAP